MPNSTDDRVPYWLIIFSVAWPLAFVLSRAMADPAGGILAAIVCVWAVLAGAVATILCGVWAYQQHWRRFFATLPLPLTVLIGGLNFNGAVYVGQTAGDYLHFCILYPAYAAEVAALPADQPRFVVFDWGDRGVLYDESDQISAAYWSDEWQEKATAHGVVNWSGTRIFGHFYFVMLNDDRSTGSAFIDWRH